jgi:hypothetical protein
MKAWMTPTNGMRGIVLPMGVRQQSEYQRCRPLPDSRTQRSAFSPSVMRTRAGAI